MNENFWSYMKITQTRHQKGLPTDGWTGRVDLLLDLHFAKVMQVLKDKSELSRTS